MRILKNILNILTVAVSIESSESEQNRMKIVEVGFQIDDWAFGYAT